MFVLPLSRPSASVRGAAVPHFSSVVDRLFDASLDRCFGGASAADASRTPAMDVFESESDYTVVLDVPGATREQLKVAVEGRRVVLTSAVKTPAVPPQGEGEPAAEAARPAGRAIYRERALPVFSRTVVLPADVDQAGSRARFDNGVLTLTLAKKLPAATQLNIA